MSTLTIANSVITLSVDKLYPTPVQLQQYAADDVYDFEEIEAAETTMGVDGILSGGMINVELPWAITLQANSPSCSIFDQWYAYQKVNDLVRAQVNIGLPGLGTKWALVNGILKKYSPAPSAKKIAQPRKFSIVFESFVPSPT